MTGNDHSKNDKWQQLHGQRIELALLQVDIVAHSQIVAGEADKLAIKLIFGETIRNVAIAHGGKSFNWAGDGGSFMFLTGGQGFNDLVNAAIEMFDELPQLNERILRDTGLKAPIHVRISCHSGLATYRIDPNEISGDFINLFLKHEKAVGSSDTVCISESVHQQLSASLQNRFRWKKQSKELGCAIYELRVDQSDSEVYQRTKGALPLWTFFIAPALGLGIAFIMRMQPGIVSLVVLAVALLNAFFISRKSKRESTEDQDFVYTLLKDDLLAPKTGRPLVFQAKVVIVEDEDHKSAFINRLDQDFKGPNEPKDSNLILIPFTCHKSRREADERMLRLTLEGANAVVVVWTKEMKEQSWVYKTIDSWAFDRSDVPILFALADRTIPEPEGYLHVPEDSKSLPWRLVQRGNERARDWRGAASFNRMVLGNALLILLMASSAAGILLYEQKKVRQSTAGDMFHGVAVNVKEQFLNTIVVRKLETENPKVLDLSDFHVSFWFSECGDVRQFASTESGEDYKRFDLKESSAIGAAFACGSCVTEARPNSYTRIWDIHDDEKTDNSSRMYNEQNKDRRLVACASHGPDLPDPKSTVGICIFTNHDYVTLDDNNYRKTLRERTKELFDRASPYVANGGIAGLPETATLRKLIRSYRCLLD
jgi:class 3 adenylate cyclase